MVAGSTRLILIVGIVVGATLLGGIIGAGVDYVTADAGWWGAGGLIGLMAAAMIVSTLVERGRSPKRG